MQAEKTIPYLYAEKTRPAAPRPTQRQRRVSAPLLRWSATEGSDPVVALLAAVGRDQHLGHLGPGELDPRNLAPAEHLAHLRPGQEDVVLLIVRTGLGRGHRAARPAEERVVEEHRLDVELVRLELVEDQVGVVGAVVAPHARVIASDDEVRAAVVLAAERVPDRLAGPG